MTRASRNAFLKALRSTWVPELKRAGFVKGNGTWEFRRSRSPYLDLVGWQQRSDAEAGCVNLGVHLDFLPPPSSDNLSPLDCSIGNCAIETRLTPSPDLWDFWWVFGDAEDEAVRSAGDLECCFAERGLEFFDYYSGLPGPFGLVTVDSLRSGAYLRDAIRGHFDSPALAALALARIHKHLGDWQKAAAFAQFGIGLGLKHKFQPILDRAAEAIGNTSGPSEGKAS